MDPTMIVYPSGSVRFSSWAAMAPLAPGLFSTTKLTPRRLVRPGATERAVMSEDPPGTNGTMMVTGLSGYPAAPAAWAHARVRQAMAKAMIGLVMVSPRAHGCWNAPPTAHAGALHGVA